MPAFRLLLDACSRVALPAFVVVPPLAALAGLSEAARQHWAAQGMSWLAVEHVVSYTAGCAGLAAVLLLGLFALEDATSPQDRSPIRRIVGGLLAWGLFLVPLYLKAQPLLRLLVLENDRAPMAVQVLLALPQELASTSALFAAAAIVLARLRSGSSRRVPALLRALFRPRPWALAAGVLLAAAGLGIERFRPEPPPGAPNMVVVVIDTLRADHLGMYGYDARETSPLLDAFARDAIVYENAVAAAPWTTPSVSSMFTSRYPRRLGFREVPLFLAAGETTFAEVLRSRGFRTHAVVSNVCASSAVGLDAGFEEMDESQLADQVQVSSAGVTDRALAWLEANHDDPFLLYVHYLDPHFAYIMHEQANFDPDYAGPFRGSLVHSKFVADLHALTERDLDYLLASYDSELVITDAEVGRLLDGVRRLGLYDDALIVVTSDHGEAFDDRGDHFVGHGPTVQQELVRVPLLVRHPGGERSGTRVGGPVSLLDVAPTLLAAAGAAFPPGIELDGVVLDRADPGRLIFTETRRDRERRAVYRGPWKLLIDREDGSTALFDLEADQGERNDLSSQRSGLAGELGEALDQWEAALGEPSGEAALFDPGQQERLEGLGYVQ